MQLKIFSIRDSKGETYNTPFFQKTHGEAERTFRELANDEKSIVNKYADDFDLYYLGEFDTDAGSIKALNTPQHILKAINVSRPKSSIQPVDLSQVHESAKVGANSLVHPKQ